MTAPAAPVADFVVELWLEADHERILVASVDHRGLFTDTLWKVLQIEETKRNRKRKTAQKVKPEG